MNQRVTVQAARRLGPAALLVSLGLAGGFAYTALKPPSYSASAYVIAMDSRDRDAPVALNFAQAYARLARERSVLASTRTRAPGGSTAVTRRHVHASSSPETPLIQITGTGARPGSAAAYANSAADALVNYAGGRQNETGVRLAAMGSASLPARPSSPDPPLNLAVGAATGVLLAALALAGTRDRSGRRSAGEAAGAGRARPEAREPAEAGK